jgi:putative transposase
MNNNSLPQAHTKWDCSYHIIFIPKYRRKVMYKELRKEIGGILRRLCEFKKIELVEGSISIDHVHMYLKIPPKEKISDLIEDKITKK